MNKLFCHIWSNKSLSGDLAIMDRTQKPSRMSSAVIRSWFTDAPAQIGDKLPDGSINQRNSYRGGHWAAAVTGKTRGSRLWLLKRAKQTEDTRLRAILYGTEALRWMIKTNLVSEINVDAQWVGTGFLKLTAELVAPDGSKETVSHDWAWKEVALNG